jgi:hypothetical protein
VLKTRYDSIFEQLVAKTSAYYCTRNEQDYLAVRRPKNYPDRIPVRDLRIDIEVFHDFPTCEAC